MKATVAVASVLLTIVSTGAAQGSQSSLATPARPHHLSHRQANHLISTASTPEQHMSLAEYYRQEAERNRAKEEHDRATAATYRMHPPRADAYRNTPTASYFESLADSTHALADADDLLAKYHEQLAGTLSESR